ncbi:MAG TPA: TIGR00341 family protein, partial [Anaeromyxobacteraceae bacterium]|nr:TIGR00341 family protein [Anaeromyxobacteraceae bacterium]
KEETSIEEAARKKFGLESWDRTALFRETAEAATDTDLPFWTVLLLSGAIATLGLALDQTAVVIGAMLIAPLLGPLLGLSLALAVGDGRLAIQTAATLLLGMAGVIAVSALLTVLLPFQNVTGEILARTRPTTLDLAIAVASGLAGAVVTLSREQRLSASIPGVAIAVALIPPLGVTGFGIGTGMQGPLIRGSLLLFGANLGGIVLSGLLAFLLVGMHRPDVVEAARRWHREGARRGLAARIEEAPVLRRVRVFGSAWARVGLVLAFVGAVAVPLSSSLQRFIRETRVQGAVSGVAEALRGEGNAAVLSRDVALGDGRTTARFRVATTAWIGEDERRALERAASRDAGEPITITLDQLIASDERLDSLVAAATQEPAAPAPDPKPAATLSRLQSQIDGALGGLALPDGTTALGAE